MDQNTKLCKHCKTEIHGEANICPQCGKKQKKGMLWKIVIGVIALIVIVNMLSSDDEKSSSVNDDTKVEATITPTESVEDIEDSVEETNDDTQADDSLESEDSAEDSNENTIENTTENTSDEKIPTEYKSALRKAETYSDIMHMSKAGIYDQLTSEYGEQFTKEEAQYAVDHVDANWKENALQKAKDYQEMMDMSPAAIREQLTSEYGEQFTKEEADYAIANLD